MKKFLFFTLILTSFLKIQAQTDTAITFTHINTVQDISKQIIYERVKLWSVSSFKNVSGALQLDDKESGLLAYDASAQELSPNAPKTDVTWKLVEWFHKYTFKFKIQIKDGKYKVDITDIKSTDAAGEYHELTLNKIAPYKYTFSKQSKADREWADMKVTFENFISKFFISLDKEITKKDDW